MKAHAAALAAIVVFLRWLAVGHVTATVGGATFTVPGIYVIACRPHMTMGMIGVALVGDPINIDKLDPSSLPDKARTKLGALLEPFKKS